MSGRERQTGIYLGGISGRRPRVPVDPVALEERAAETMRPEAFAYVAAGAGGEGTVRANRAAFDRWRIVPRMLRDVSERDTAIELFGRRLDSPFLLAPIGVLELAHRHADLAVARAARSEGVPMIFSNQASRPMEACAEALGESPRWLQLYWSSSDELVESLVSRAEACRCEAIVVTLDTTILGWRPRDLDPAFLPFLRGKGIAQYTSDPVFRRLASEGSAAPGTPQPRPSLSALRTLFQVTRASDLGRSAVQRFIEIYSRPSLTWEDLPFLRERTRLPILLKGILHPDDATRAVEAGMDGIVVSNHGGRQLDGVAATIQVLPEVVEAVEGRAEVFVDGGVRRGTDVVKALALGARAAMVGRPVLWGLAGGGEEGARHVLELLRDEVELALLLCGCPTPADVTPAHISANSGRS